MLQNKRTKLSIVLKVEGIKLYLLFPFLLAKLYTLLRTYVSKVHLGNHHEEKGGDLVQVVLNSSCIVQREL